jgi:hypothetical protein
MVNVSTCSEVSVQMDSLDSVQYWLKIQSEYIIHYSF